MATRFEVEQFLDKLKVKIEIFGIEVDDYCEGPIKEQLNGFGEMWVFGKDVKGQEVYIKIALGHPDSNTIVISFHIAEHSMSFPFK